MGKTDVKKAKAVSTKIGPLERVMDKLDSVLNEYYRECEKSNYRDCETPALSRIRRLKRIAENALKRCGKK